MKILLGNNSLDILAGSETWTLTMAKELKRLGHEVMAYSDKLGFIATRLEEIGVKCVNQFNREDVVKPYDFVMRETDDYSFDVIICSHHHITGYLRRMFPKTPIISTIHGILHKDSKTGQIFPEHPNLDANVNQFVAVSEEVQSVLKDGYGLESVVIRNPFDLDIFSCKDIQENGIKGMLINSNYQGKDDDITNVIRDAANIFNDAQLRAIGINFQASYEVQDTIKEVDVVVGMGRSVLEGVAMGKIGLVHGRWGTGGVITPTTVEKLAWYNFSGRNSGGEIKSAVEIVALIKEANTIENKTKMLEYMRQNHDVKVVAQKYLEIAELYIKYNNAF